MNEPKLLIDTNILIGLEDNKEVDKNFSSLQNKCQSNGVQIFVHEASLNDIERDKDNPRKKITISKIAKFPSLDGILLPDKTTLEKTYGPITKANDWVDVALLYTLHEVGAIDFLVTQDRGIHKRASQLDIADRVFYVEDALVWLREKYDRTPVTLPFIEEKKCHQINHQDDIFDSLRRDYTTFDQWFKTSCVKQHRSCWTINFANEIAGIAIRKDESYSGLISSVPLSEVHFQRPPKKILKICTFKIKEKYRGEKFGEQLLKQVLWWAKKNVYDLVYLTIYPKHKNLVDLLLKYGFENIGRGEGELYLAKSFEFDILKTKSPSSALLYHRQYYPNFISNESVQKFLIPIRSDYYATLFPENVHKKQPGLFDADSGIYGNRISGNTIRKVYVCRAIISTIKPGDILLFFHLKDENSFDSQCIVTIGVVDGFDTTNKNEELQRLTAKRSVFNQQQLEDFTEGNLKNVKIINFLLARHIDTPFPYNKMESIGIKGPYQSIRSITNKHYNQLKSEIE
ncbi:MAG: GNAT family N-acetyltransferase [Pseudomonadota bacterium]